MSSYESNKVVLAPLLRDRSPHRRNPSDLAQREEGYDDVARSTGHSRGHHVLCGRMRTSCGFHERAILCGHLGDDLIAGPIAELYDLMPENPAPAATVRFTSSTQTTTTRSAGDPFSCETLGIEITGRVGTARVPESDHHGVVMGHFHLSKGGEP